MSLWHPVNRVNPSKIKGMADKDEAVFESDGNSAPKLADVIRVLSASRDDAAVLRWLNSGNRAWPMRGWANIRAIIAQENNYWSPQQMIRAGRTAEVLQVATTDSVGYEVKR